MTRREELIFLLESFLNGNIDLDYFSKEFSRVFFDVKKDSDKIPRNQEAYMKELALMCNKYSSNDVLLNSFYSEKDLITKIGAWGKSIS